MKVSGLYCITNKINDKKYIGQSVDIYKRWGCHKTGKEDSYISRAIRKYGIENFEFEVIMFCCGEWMDHWEKFLIAKYDTISPFGYNIEGGGKRNKQVSQSTREKMSKSRKGSIPWNKGIPMSEESKQKISIANTGNKFHLNKNHSDETKEKISKTKIGVTSQMKGRKSNISDLGRKSISDSVKSRVITDETRHKCSLAAQKRWSKTKSCE